MSEWKVKRFWTKVSTEPVNGGFGVRLDGRVVKTPAKAELILPTVEFAERVAEEWQAQVEKVDPETMPATRTANAAIDKVATQKSEVADMLAAYGDADLLCYRAIFPDELVARQSSVWDPYLEWAEKELGVRLQPRPGVMHYPQNSDDIAKLTHRVHGLSNFELAAFHDLVSMSGSLILGFAATCPDWRPSEIWDASRIDEIWQEEQWGLDDVAVALTAQKRTAFMLAAEFFSISRIKP